MTKLKYDDIAKALRALSDASMEKRGGYGYATGVCESMLSTLIAELPGHRQREFVKLINDLTVGLEK